MNISKSSYTCARQCYKKLWLNKYEPELAKWDGSVEQRFDTGHFVGECAWNLFPGGTKVEYNKNTSDMAAITRGLIEDGVEVIYEAAFVHENLIAICDILAVTASGFEIYEVKSSTSVKDVYYDDISFQCFVLQKCGYKVSKASIVHINNKYVRNGELDYSKLFTMVDVTEKVSGSYKEIEDKVAEIAEMLKGEKPDIDIGEHCSKPYECEFSAHCRSHLPEYSVFDLYNHRGKAFEYYRDGILSLDDVENRGIILKGIQKLQLEAKANNCSIIDKSGIHLFLCSLKYPLYFLDFESFQEAVPSYDGCRPYEQIPFQYSLHYIESENGGTKHKEFLAKEGTNPKRELAEHLCMDIKALGTVVAYNKVFEGSIIGNLAGEFPELSKHLLSIKDSLVDLIEPFRKGYYYASSMKGSFSIKSVLPALFPDDDELNYNKLNIKNGSEAMAAFPTLMTMDEEQRIKIRNALLEYCKLDTLAMVKILQKLKAV